MGRTSLTATEVSASTAIAVAVGFLFGGEILTAVVAFGVGVALFAAHHVFGIENITRGRDDIEALAEQVVEELDNLNPDDLDVEDLDDNLVELLSAGEADDGGSDGDEEASEDGDSNDSTTDSG